MNAGLSSSHKGDSSMKNNIHVVMGDFLFFFYKRKEGKKNIPVDLITIGYRILSNSSEALLQNVGRGDFLQLRKPITDPDISKIL